MKNMTAMNAKRKQAGFTIIELVVVILLLGILTATALPRFMDVTDEAHDAVVDAVQGGFTTGVALFRAQWVAEGQPLEDETDDTGYNLFASTAGYPRSNTDENTSVAALDTATTCTAVYDSVIQASGRPTIASAEDGLAADDDEERETVIETATTANPTADFIAVLEKDAATPTDATVSCSYYYVGQHKSGTDAVQNSIPKITYNFETGAIVRAAELVMLTD